MNASPAGSMPGRAAHIDPDAQLCCPECSATSLTITNSEHIEGATWLNCFVTCASCQAISHLAVVSFGGRVVVRWLPPEPSAPAQAAPETDDASTEGDAERDDTDAVKVKEAVKA